MSALTPDSTPREVQEAWAARLEANPQRQGKGYLAPTPTTRCCLGELSDMAVEAGVIAGYNALNGMPEHEVSEWAGLCSNNPAYRTEDGERFLADDNDRDRTWPQIAATIRARPPGLFVDEDAA